MVFFLLHLRRRTLSVAALAIVSTAGQAGELDAWHAYQRQDHLLAQQLYAEQSGYAARMGEGASAFRRKDYGYAVKQFTDALLTAGTPDERADALFNLGNAHYLAGNPRAALDAFQGVLRYRDDARARANLARVTAQLKPGAAPAGEGVSGRRGLGLGQGENIGGDAPMGMEAEKDRPQVLQEQSNADSDAARGKPGARAAQQSPQADLRAAQKKLELVRDHPAHMSKRLITQDRGEQTRGSTRPW